MEEIRRAAERAQLNIGTKRTVSFVANFVCAAGAAGLLAAVVSLFVPILHETVILLALFGAGVIAGLVAGFVRRPSLREAALILDSKGLKEHVSTALENEGNDNLFAEMQRNETRKLIENIDVGKLLKTTPDYRKLLTMFLFFGVAIVLFNVPCLAHDKADAIAQVLQEKQAVKDDPEIDAKTKDIMAEAMDKAAKEMAKAKTSKELADIDRRLEKKLSEAEKKENAGAERADSGDGGRSSDSSQGGDNGGNKEGSDGGDTGESGDGSEKDGSTTSGSAVASGNASKVAGKVTEATGQHTESAQSGDGMQVDGSGSDGGDRNGNGSGGSAIESSGNSAGEGSGSGNGGDGNGNGQGTGGGSGEGRGNGGGTGYNMGSQNGVERKVNTEDGEKLLLPGETTGGGTLDGKLLEGQTYATDDTILGDGQYGTEIDYGSVVQDYEDRAISRIESGRIASEYKDLIKNYFSGINK